MKVESVQEITLRLSKEEAKLILEALSIGVRDPDFELHRDRGMFLIEPLREFVES